MKLLKISLTLAFVAPLFIGCSAKEIKPTARKVRITTKEPSQKRCKYLGQISGDQGNFFTGGWTSNKNLEVGARNSLKNEAAELGANVVHLVTNRAANTGSGGQWGGHSSQTNVIYVGEAYYCKKHRSRTRSRSAKKNIGKTNSNNG